MKEIDREALIEAFKAYLEEHPEVVYKILSSSAILDRLATKEDLRLLIEMMNARFEALQREMDKRFEAVDKRLDSLEKRLSFMQWVLGIGLSFLGILITVLNLFAK